MYIYQMVTINPFRNYFKNQVIKNKFTDYSYYCTILITISMRIV